MNQLMTPIGLNVKRLRAAAGLTQQELAVAAGLSVSIVSQIEQGSNADPRGSTLQALATVLNATVDELLRVSEEKTAGAEADQAAAEGKPSSSASAKGRRKAK